MNGSNNSLLLSGIIIVASLLTVTFVTACESNAPEIYQGMCSLIGGAIGAGGAALAVYLTLNWQQEDERHQAIRGLYTELYSYLTRCTTYHGILKAGLEGDEEANKYMLVGVARSACNLPPAVFFPAVLQHITRLKRPSLVVSFYSSVDRLRNSCNCKIFSDSESDTLTSAQMRFAIVNILVVLKSGLMLLKLIDFNQIEIADRVVLIKRLQDEIAGSPAAVVMNYLEHLPE